MYRSSTSVRHEIYILINVAVISSVPGAPLGGLVWGNKALPPGLTNCQPGHHIHIESSGSRDRPTPKHGIGVKGLSCREPTWFFNLPHARQAQDG